MGECRWRKVEAAGIPDGYALDGIERDLRYCAVECFDFARMLGDKGDIGVWAGLVGEELVWRHESIIARVGDGRGAAP